MDRIIKPAHEVVWDLKEVEWVFPRKHPRPIRKPNPYSRGYCVLQRYYFQDGDSLWIFVRGFTVNQVKRMKESGEIYIFDARLVEVTQSNGSVVYHLNLRRSARKGRNRRLFLRKKVPHGTGKQIRGSVELPQIKRFLTLEKTN